MERATRFFGCPVERFNKRFSDAVDDHSAARYQREASATPFVSSTLRSVEVNQTQLDLADRRREAIKSKVKYPRRGCAL